MIDEQETEEAQQDQIATKFTSNIITEWWVERTQEFSG